MYQFYLDGVLLPVTPSSLTMKINDKDETVDLINGEVFTVMNYPGLTEWEFEFLLPGANVPFIHPNATFIKPQEYLNHLESLKTSRKPFQFIMIRSTVRTTNSLDATQDTNVKVTLKDMSVTEDAGEYGNARMVKVVLRQYKTYRTERVSVSSLKNGAVVSTNSTDRVLYMVKEGTYVVQQGDTLRSISFKFFGDEKYAEALAAYQTKPPLEFTLEPLVVGTTLQIDIGEIKALYEKMTVTTEDDKIWSYETYVKGVEDKDITQSEYDMYIGLIQNVCKPKKTNFWDTLSDWAMNTDKSTNTTLIDVVTYKEGDAAFSKQPALIQFGMLLEKLLDMYDKTYKKSHNDQISDLENDYKALENKLKETTNSINNTKAEIEELEDSIVDEPDEVVERLIEVLESNLESLMTVRDELEKEMSDVNERLISVQKKPEGEVTLELTNNEITSITNVLNSIKDDRLYASTLTTWVYEIGLLEGDDE